MKQSGQTLVTLVFFMGIAMTIIASAAIILFINAQGVTKFQEGMSAYYIAESGIENAILRLLRNPSYAGETLNLDSGVATVQVVNRNPIAITSVGKVGNFVRKIEATASYTNNILTITSWKEIF
ncbi:hypothetical protein HYW87_04815 [Candidatus Roizmanbacteria bacterium]|nr:hypothetical protein [Candidatus Roizmanbacteria bacterium]